jgi:hypothetical protein
LRSICFGGVKPTDTHLALAIHRVNKEIIGWLEPVANSISNLILSQVLQQMLLRTAACTATNVCPEIQNWPCSFACSFLRIPARGIDNGLPQDVF